MLLMLIFDIKLVLVAERADFPKNDCVSVDGIDTLDLYGTIQNACDTIIAFEPSERKGCIKDTGGITQFRAACAMSRGAQNV